VDSQRAAEIASCQLRPDDLLGHDAELSPAAVLSNACRLRVIRPMVEKRVSKSRLLVSLVSSALPKNVVRAFPAPTMTVLAPMKAPRKRKDGNSCCCPRQPRGSNEVVFHSIGNPSSTSGQRVCYMRAFNFAHELSERFCCV